MSDYATARTNMVDNLLRPNRVTDPRVLRAFLEVPREDYAPENFRRAAYVDRAIPLGSGRFLLDPMVLGQLIQEAACEPTDKALVVGSDVGYSAALLTRLTASVVALECDAGLLERARAIGGSGNVSFIEGPLEAGCLARGPYDVILVGGAVPAVPSSLVSQLATGGRLVGIVHSPGQVLGEALVLEKIGDAVSRRNLFETGARLLPGFAPQAAFSF